MYIPTIVYSRPQLVLTVSNAAMKACLPVVHAPAMAHQQASIWSCGMCVRLPDAPARPARCSILLERANSTTLGAVHLKLSMLTREMLDDTTADQTDESTIARNRTYERKCNCIIVWGCLHDAEGPSNTL